MVTSGGNDTPVLVARGNVTAAGNLTLDLPGKPNPALLRPASAWRDLLGVSQSVCDSGTPQGQVVLSDVKAKLLVLGDLQVLSSTFPASASAQQLIDAPLEQEHTLWSGNFSSGISKLRLIWSSGPLSVHGKQLCADGSGSLTVNFSLPGGWSALNDELKVPDNGSFKTSTLLNPGPGQEKQGWHDSRF